MIKKFFLILILIMISFISWNKFNLSQYIQSYLPQEILKDNTSLNMVSAIVLDYRIYDTLFEVIVFTVAVTGISKYLMKLPEYGDYKNEKDSVVETMIPIIFQIIVLISLYIAITGHIAPGGGFSAGVILGTGLLGVSFVKPMEDIEKIFVKSKIEKLKVLVPFIIIIYAISGYIFKGVYFYNFGFFGEPGTLFSGGSAIILNLLIAFEVFSGTWTILYKFIKHRGQL